MLPVTKERRVVLLACEKAGGMRALGRALGIPYQMIQVWKKIPCERLVAIEKVTGIPRELLRPELYRKSTKVVDS